MGIHRLVEPKTGVETRAGQAFLELSADVMTPFGFLDKLPLTTTCPETQTDEFENPTAIGYPLLRWFLIRSAHETLKNSQNPSMKFRRTILSVTVIQPR